MGIFRKIFGPRSKYDKALPYTYMAVVPAIQGEDDVIVHYYADTVCGIIEYLKNNHLGPDEVKIFCIYRRQEIPLDVSFCTNPEGRWLTRPDICKSLEEHYNRTLEVQYLGHVDQGDCSFDDRSRQASGPY